MTDDETIDDIPCGMWTVWEPGPMLLLADRSALWTSVPTAHRMLTFRLYGECFVDQVVDVLDEELPDGMSFRLEVHDDRVTVRLLTVHRETGRRRVEESETFPWAVSNANPLNGAMPVGIEPDPDDPKLGIYLDEVVERARRELAALAAGEPGVDGG